MSTPLNTQESQHHLVLYVDDEKLSCRYFARLCKGKVNIQTFDTAPSALNFLEQRGQEVCMIISDQRMPGMKGTELLKEVQEKYPHVKRVLTSGFLEIANIETLKEEGLISCCLGKPWNVKEVLELLSTAPCVP